ncbi:MAG: chemotaxis protein CheB [Spirochaetales bacterium]
MEEHSGFYAVAIGASAGGLEAIESFFDNARSYNNLAYIVVQHLSPDYKSLMDELLAKHTRMPIHVAEDGMVVEAGNVYLIPRKANMTIFNGRLFLTEQQVGLNLPIDIFMKSLAEDFGERAVAVVLSGTGSDGTRGVRQVKEAGGLVLVQDEESAKFDGMPRSAIATGIVDFVLPPGKMPPEIERFVTSSVAMTRSDGEVTIASSSTIARILMLIKRRTGVDLSYYKESTINRRIERRIGITKADSVNDYLEMLQDHPAEITTLFKEILIGVTKFFRDPEAFEILAARVIPAVISEASPREPIRIWVPACSTGEEAYSIAILMTEYLETHNLDHTYRVFATDIDKDAIQFASQGMYPESIAADASHERLSRYFVRRGDSYQIARKIRENVIFAYHNVFRDPPFRRIDLVSCRNLLIYFQPTLQRKVLTNFSFSLKEKGFLLLGSSESIGDFGRFFDSFDIRWKVFRSTATGPKRDADSTDSAGLAEFLDRVRSTSSNDYQTRPQSLESVYERLVEQFLPPTIIISPDRTVEHVFGDVSRFLRVPAGKLDMNLMKMAKEPLNVPLGDALREAEDKLRPVVSTNIGFEVEGAKQALNLGVYPLPAASGDYLYAVVFGELASDGSDGAEIRAFDPDEAVKRRIQSLENELQYNKESLQATIEELETSNEELQATNEELLSSNEELQSTNEELQSVNEELISVNAEYQKKIEELSQLNDDIDNLLASIDIGTVFLDRDLAIRKYTPAATDQIRVIKTDIGRPFADLSHNLEYEGLEEDVQHVVRTGESIERETRSTDGRWYIVRMLPYDRSGNEASGVVITLIDITRRRVAELALERQAELQNQILDSTPAAIVKVDRRGKISFANERAEKLLGLTRSELGHLTYDAPEFKITDSKGNELKSEELPFAIIVETGKPLLGYRHFIVRNGGNRVELEINGSPVLDDEGDVNGAVFSIIEA